MAFDGLDRGDVVIGFIGSDQPDFDRIVLQAFDASGLRTSYLSTDGVDDAQGTAQQGIRDMAERQVAIIVVSRPDITDDTAGGWDDALGDARGAGIPTRPAAGTTRSATPVGRAYRWRCSTRWGSCLTTHCMRRR